LGQVLSVVQQVGAALHYAHMENVLHRDVKPGNIMLQADGRALVADFGIAKAADAATATTVMPGTPAYMSPEQCRSEPLDVRADVYALGIVVYEMLAGRRPFVGDRAQIETQSTREQIRWEQLYAPPPLLSQLNPAVPREVEAVVLRALAKERDARWPTVLAFCQAFERAARAAGEVPTELPVRPRKERGREGAKPAPAGSRASLRPPALRGEDAAGGAAVPSATPEVPPAQPGRPAVPSWVWVAGAAALVVAVVLIVGSLLPPRPGPTPTRVPTSTPADDRVEVIIPADTAEVPTALPEAADTSDSSMAPVPGPTCASGITHVVGGDDTAATIAQMYGVRVGELVAANGMQDLDVLRLGQVLCIPEAGPDDPATLPPTKTPSAVPTPSAAEREQELLGRVRWRPENGTPVFAYRAVRPPAMDGHMDHGQEWTGRGYGIDHIVNEAENWTGLPDSSGTFYVSWDQDHLYLGVEILDDRHVQLSSGRTLYLGDDIEIQLDADLLGDYNHQDWSEDDVQLGLAVRGFGPGEHEAYIWKPSELEIASDVDFGARRTSSGYVVEVALPWWTLYASPRVETPYGFALNLGDNDTPGTTDQESMVSSSPNRKWGDPTTWGTLILVDW
jgi:hypothetical protein